MDGGGSSTPISFTPFFLALTDATVLPPSDSDYFEPLVSGSWERCGGYISERGFKDE